MRVVVGEDELLFREGLVRLLSEAGMDVVADAADATDLVHKAIEHRPAVVVSDVRMPPEQTDDGLRAALEIRRRMPGTGVVILSHHVAEGPALELFAEGADGLAYLLKQRVGDLDGFVDTVRRIAAGGCAIDPHIVQRLLRAADPAPLDALTPREREVLALMAEGCSNHGIACRFGVTGDAVEKHIRAILRKLDVRVEPTEHRRVLAVLTYLRHGPDARYR